MAIFHDATRLVGRTPLLALDRLKQKLGLKADIFAKLECFNVGQHRHRAGVCRRGQRV